VLIIRTSGAAWRLPPHRILAATLFGSLAVALILPWLPLAGMLGFEPLGAGLSLSIAGLVIAYLLLAELLKRWALPAAERMVIGAR